MNLNSLSWWRWGHWVTLGKVWFNWLLVETFYHQRTHRHQHSGSAAVPPLHPGFGPAAIISLTHVPACKSVDGNQFTVRIIQSVEGGTVTGEAWWKPQDGSVQPPQWGLLSQITTSVQSFTLEHRWRMCNIWERQHYLLIYILSSLLLWHH